MRYWAIAWTDELLASCRSVAGVIRVGAPVRKNSTAVLRCIAVVMASVLALGCSKSPYEMAPVHGVVTIDGRAMSAGRVMFAPIAQEGKINAGMRAFGEIQPDGRFVLGTYSDADGAVVAKHWVTIFPAKRKKGDAARITHVSNSAEKTVAFDRITVPSGAVEVVAGKDNEINIALTSQDISRYGQKEDD